MNTHTYPHRSTPMLLFSLASVVSCVTFAAIAPRRNQRGVTLPAKINGDDRADRLRNDPWSSYYDFSQLAFLSCRW
jgi:hypothetical protein